jgi:hypothetical protein
MMTESNKSIESCSNKKTMFLDDANYIDCTPSSSDGLTLEDLFHIRMLNFNAKNNNSNNTINSNSKNNKMQSLSALSRAALDFKAESIALEINDKKLLVENTFYYSMPNLNGSLVEIELNSKHMSFYDLRYLPEIVFMRRRSKKKLNSTPILDELKTDNLKISPSNASFNYSRLTSFDKLMSYWTRLGDSLRKVIQNTFKYTTSNDDDTNTTTLTQNKQSDSTEPTNPFYKLILLFPYGRTSYTNSSPITQELLDTYDIIEMDDAILQIKSSSFHSIIQTTSSYLKANKTYQKAASTTTTKTVSLIMFFFVEYFPLNQNKIHSSRYLILN